MSYLIRRRVDKVRYPVPALDRSNLCPAAVAAHQEQSIRIAIVRFESRKCVTRMWLIDSQRVHNQQLAADGVNTHRISPVNMGAGTLIFLFPNHPPLQRSAECFAIMIRQHARNKIKDGTAYNEITQKLFTIIFPGEMIPSCIAPSEPVFLIQHEYHGWILLNTFNVDLSGR